MFFKKCVTALGVISAIGLLASSQACSSSGSGTDGGTEASADDTGVKDTGVKDTGSNKDSGQMDSGPMCPNPGDVSTFMAPAYKPPITPSALCTAMQVQQYFDDCFGPNGTQMKCQADITNFAACAKCLESNGTMDSNWGATVDIGPAADPNVAGCVALLGETECSKAIEAATWCENAACEDQCWTSSAMMDADFSAYLKCLDNAGGSVCKTYESTVTTACGGDAAGAYKQCTDMVMNDFQTGYNAFAVMICEGGG